MKIIDTECIPDGKGYHIITLYSQDNYKFLFMRNRDYRELRIGSSIIIDFDRSDFNDNKVIRLYRDTYLVATICVAESDPKMIETIGRLVDKLDDL